MKAIEKTTIDKKKHALESLILAVARHDDAEVRKLFSELDRLRVPFFTQNQAIDIGENWIGGKKLYYTTSLSKLVASITDEA